MLDDFCFKAKNLYNCAVYHFRQALFGKQEATSYNRLDKQLKAENDGVDYRSIPLAWSAQWVIKQAENNFKAFYAACKSYAKAPEKFLSRPKPPNYLDKVNGRQMLQLNCKTIKDGKLQFPKTYNGFTIKLPDYVKNIQVVRIVPKNRHIVIEVVYRVEVADKKTDNGFYAGIDLGLDNLATVVSNTGNTPLLINGKGLKSLNQFWNKQQAHYKSVNDAMNGSWRTTKAVQTKSAERSEREETITNKRNKRVKTFLHQTSRKIVDIVLEWGCHTIVIGHNDNWKQESNIGRVNNQRFVQIPFNQLMSMIVYKAEALGIQVTLTEESYTSKASALHRDFLPTYSKDTKESHKFSGNRIHRGLYASDKGMINADVNGALNIIRKVVRDDLIQRIEGYSNPVSVAVH
jgi:putative transposase